jgi:hypothetical protein
MSIQNIAKTLQRIEQTWAMLRKTSISIQSPKETLEKKVGKLSGYSLLAEQLREEGALVTDNGRILQPDRVMTGEEEAQTNSEFYTHHYRLKNNPIKFQNREKAVSDFPNIKVGTLELKFTKWLNAGGTKEVLEAEIVSTGKLKGMKLAVVIPFSDRRESIALAELRKQGVPCNDFSEVVTVISTNDRECISALLMCPFSELDFQVYDPKNRPKYSINPDIEPPITKEISTIQELLQTPFWQSMADEVLGSFNKGHRIFSGDELAFRKLENGKWGFYIMDVQSADLIKSPKMETLQNYVVAYGNEIFEDFLEILSDDIYNSPNSIFKGMNSYRSPQKNEFIKLFTDLVLRKKRGYSLKKFDLNS